MGAALAVVVLVLVAGTGAYSVGRFESGISTWPGATLIPRLFGVASVPMPGGLPLIGGPDIPSMNYPDDWPGPHGSLQVGGFFTRAGARLSGPAAQAMVSQVPRPALTSTARLRTWLAARRISFWIEYQPASRYWLFQGIVAAILLALAAAAGCSAVRLAGRRR